MFQHSFILRLGHTSRLMVFLFICFITVTTCPPSMAETYEHPSDVDMNFRQNIVVEKPTVRVDSNSTADHSKFEELKQPFSSGPEVTKTCLKCHTEAGHQFMKNIHWTWNYKNEKTGQLLGKKHLVNNFCTNARGNEGMCAQCHAGYGWKDETFDFTNQDNIDCIVCHDRSGTYYKTPPTEGNATCSIMFEGKQPIQWSEVAQSVGLPARENCGGCHFYGGGGDGVKHGDLDSSLIHPDKKLDVHMDEAGLNFSCNSCHVSDKHIWEGSRYDVVAKDTKGTGKPGQRRDVATCESCHGLQPHPNDSLSNIKLNNHIDRIACQTCHIPTIARGGVATMTDWDWRTAGKTKNGEGYKEKEYTQGDGEHRATYKSIKGDFKYAENLVPHYGWFNGQMIYTTIDTKFDPSKGVVDINSYVGSATDGKSRIWPFKQMHTVMPYDKGNNTLVYMHLWGEDENAYWGNYDFGNAIKAGMEKNNLPYSGEYDFVDTYSYWPITHMVAPKEDALTCNECHVKDGRMTDLKGFYMPGRDSNYWLDLLGIIAIITTLLAVIAHGLIRVVMNRKRD